MIIKEYQTKELFKKERVPLLKGQVAYTPEEAREVAEEIGGNAWVIKAQVSSSNRSKSFFDNASGQSGICWANTPDMVASISEQMLGHYLKNPNSSRAYKVRRVYVEEACLGQSEYRLSLRIDFVLQCLVLTIFSAGNIMHQYELPNNKLPTEKIDKITRHLFLKGDKAREMKSLIRNLFSVFKKYEAVAVEFDPVWETNQGLKVLDGRIIFNEDALFRLPDISDLRELEAGQEHQIIAKKHQFRYTKLKGNIACLVNGIGLSQATMDLIHQSGGEVSCLLDVGTEPTREAVANSLKLALADPNVDGVLINIFGGTTRCDVIVDGILATSGEIIAGLPIVVRIDGTNANIGRRLLFESRLPFTVVKSMKEAVTQIIRQVKDGINV